MEEIVWSRDFSIKNAKLDKQHEVIFDIANKANHLANQHDIPDNEKVSELKKLLFQLFNYMNVHFADEEKYMENINFPLCEEHKKQHRVLIQKSKDLLNHKDVSTFAKELSELTKDWILEHFANEDIWIANFKTKAFDIKEIHYNLNLYSKLRSIKYDLDKQEHFDYICNCSKSNVYRVPQTIHDEIQGKQKILKCDFCSGKLVFLESDANIIHFEDLEKEFLQIEKGE